MFACASACALADAIQTGPHRLKNYYQFLSLKFLSSFFTVKNFTEQIFQVEKKWEKRHFSDPGNLSL